MYNNCKETPITIVHYYLNNGTSLRKTAQLYNIHYQTLYKWVRLYKKHGKERLLTHYRRPWKRTSKELEVRIVLLKEREPALTIREAKRLLEKEGIKISLKGIWGIWKRFGYAGFLKKDLSNNFITHYSWSIEALRKFKNAKEVFNHGDISVSAKIVNSIPALPKNELITQIPDSLLNLKRQTEKITALFGKIPLPTYLRKTRVLYKKCLRKNLLYSALRMGISEILALSWHMDPTKQLQRTKELHNLIQKKEAYFSNLLFAPRFTLLISEGISHGCLSQIKEAHQIIRYCHTLLKRRKNISSYFMINLGSLYTQFEDYRNAEYWFSQALKNTSNEQGRKSLKSRLASVFFMNGEYKKAINALKHASLHGWIDRPKELFFQAMLSFMDGMPNKAISLATNALTISKKTDLNIGIIKAYMAIASAYASLGEHAKSKRILKKLLVFSERTNKRASDAIEILLEPKSKASIHINKNLPPSTIIALLLKYGNYQKAFKYAKKKGIMAYVHRFIFFAPDAVRKLLAEGKPTGLPKPVLRLPIFSKEIPTYGIKFLGNLVVYKNQKYVRLKLQPKDTAFLIHLALKAGEPEKEIPLQFLYNNLWKNSPNPSKNLSHLLVRVKKALKIPSHLLQVSYKKDNPVFINRGIHFTTDYGEYQEHLVQAKALLGAGEWGFAKREYLQAFKLFRGEPFKKMYDDWSDDKRLEILFSYETEVLSFAKELRARGRNEEAEKLLKKAEKIVPLERSSYA